MGKVCTVTTVHDAEDLVIKALQSNLPGVQASRPSGSVDNGWDVRLNRADGSTVLLDVKRLSTTRYDDLVGRLATAALQLRNVAAHGDHHLAVLVVPRATVKAAEAVRKFATRYLPDVAWGLMDDQGSIFLEIPFWGVSLSARGHARDGQSAPVVRPALFSDLHAWMLKVLLLADVAPTLWSGPRERVTTVEDLQRVSGVSRMTSYRFLQTLESEDFVKRSAGSFSLVRRTELVRRWFAYAQHTRLELIHARSLYQSSGLVESLSDPRGMRWAVAGFAACRALGVLHASFSTSEVYVDDTARALEAWDLVGCDPRDSQLVLLRTPFGESIFRAYVPHGTLRVVDVLQAALDVSRHAARGQEQAEYIVHEVLGWKDVQLG